MKVIYWARLKMANAEVAAALAAVPGASLTVVEGLDEMLAALPGAVGLVTYDAPPDIARPVVAAIEAPGSTLRWMHILTAGRNGFESVGLPRGVQITGPAGANAPSVAEHAIAMLLALTRRVPQMLQAQAQHKWDKVGVATGARTLEEARLAIVGFGRVGQEVARRARAFGAVTLGVSRNPKPDPLLDEWHPLSDLPAVLGSADFIVLGLALTPQTRHLFDAPMLAACKPGAVLVNVARGGIVDQVALAAALVSGHLGGAGLDVTDPEPLPATDPLWDAPNLLISPHFAGGVSPASRRRLAEGAAANLQCLMAGEALRDLVR